MADLEGIFPARVSAHALQRVPDEIGTFENGGVFIAWPKPPRVGSKIRVQLAFGEDAPVELPGLVVWSRPPRPGVTGGFRAQLEQAPPLLLARLRELCSTARQRLVLREVGAARPAAAARPESEFVAVRERVRRPVSAEELEQKSTLLQPRPITVRAPEPPRETPVATERLTSIELPPMEPDEGAMDFDFHPSAAPVPEPEPAFDLEETSVPVCSVNVVFASMRSYRMHFERFLERGEVYVTSAPVPFSGELCEVLLHVPDGDPPLRAKALMEREAAPPEVPRAGWIAKLIDRDGSIAERLSTAALLAAG